MGGYGSGRHGGRDTTSDMRSLDVRQMQRNGWLAPAAAGEIYWSSNGQRTATINYRMEGKGVRLIYRSRRTGEDWKDHDYVVPLTYTPCNYGGSRVWFLCPCCGRRVAKLYGGAIYACRHCHKLAYQSQRETQDGRALRKADKMRDRLGWVPGILNGEGGKPKGMHWATYGRMLDQYSKACEVTVMGMHRRLGLIRGRIRAAGLSDDDLDFP